MRALVTNDDGVGSPGLHVLAGVAVAHGLDVVVAAPDAEYSGSSASLSAAESDGRLVLREQHLPGVEVTAFAVQASPAFIAFAAAHGAFGAPPDLVLSGVNHGPNTGHATLHSGTVGAALTARTHRASSLAVSCVSAAPQHWETSRTMASRALAWLLPRAGDRTLTLSVNVPDLPLAQVRGLRPARLAAFGAVQARVSETGRGEAGEHYVGLSFDPVDADDEPGTDAALVREGWATVTALAAPCEATGVDLSALDDGQGRMRPDGL